MVYRWVVGVGKAGGGCLMEVEGSFNLVAHN